MVYISELFYIERKKERKNICHFDRRRQNENSFQIIHSYLILQNVFFLKSQIIKTRKNSKIKQNPKIFNNNRKLH